MSINLTREERWIIRMEANAHLNCPIEVVAGDAAPQMVGESWYWQTKGGKRIHHPSAYSKKGWSSMTYCNSTRRVEVGIEWIETYLHGQVS
jgi:hypothetical protein